MTCTNAFSSHKNSTFGLNKPQGKDARETRDSRFPGKGCSWGESLEVQSNRAPTGLPPSLGTQLAVTNSDTGVRPRTGAAHNSSVLS